MTVDEHVQFVSGLIAALPDVQFTVTRLIPRGNTVAVMMTARGTFSAPFSVGEGQVIPPNNWIITAELVGVYGFENGKVVRGWGFWDTAAFMGQLRGTGP